MRFMIVFMFRVLQVTERVLHHLIECWVNVHAAGDRTIVAVAADHGVGDFLDKHGCFRSDYVGA